MPMELRKRKAPPPPAPAPTSKKATKAAKTEKDTNGSAPAEAAAAPASGLPAVGSVLALDGLGGELTLNDGTTTTLKALVEQSKAGVAIFTYPRASTPGCTQQACLFRDHHPTITNTGGFSIYGLSTDSPKANTTFQTKQKLPYPLICDPSSALIGALGLKKAPGGRGSGTTRGVVVIDKEGKVLAAMAGGPKVTVDVVLELVGGEKKDGEEVKENGKEEGEKKEEEKKEEEAKKEEEKKEEEGKTEEKDKKEEKEEEKKEDGDKMEENGEKKENGDVQMTDAPAPAEAAATTNGDAEKKEEEKKEEGEKKE
ncbi:hypothetical protein VTJ04DRAFT_8227 [Mycothermus thermophilus]|uniref:uncharacterized protein n=1 Tax=Humicola insolens TaxID=85995 RepID=UPI003742E53F